MTTIKCFFSNVNDGNLSRDCEKGIENRKQILQKIGIDFQNSTFLHQEHSEGVVYIDDLPKDKQNENRGDAIITKKKNRVISVRVADCVPMLFMMISIELLQLPMRDGDERAKGLGKKY